MRKQRIRVCHARLCIGVGSCSERAGVQGTRVKTAEGWPGMVSAWAMEREGGGGVEATNRQQAAKWRLPSATRYLDGWHCRVFSRCPEGRDTGAPPVYA